MSNSAVVYVRVARINLPDLAFLGYMAGATARQILRATDYTPCAGGPRPIVATLCGTG
jgi:hypothetical protein